MNSEVREAAGRLRAMRKASDDHDGGYPATDEGRWQSLHDHTVIANAVLPEFDETPCDDIWLVSVGGERLTGGWVVKLGPLLYSNCDGFSIGENDLQITTRGQLRTLCRALGIQIGEGE